MPIRTVEFLRTDATAESVPVVISSEFPVQRDGYREILEHTADAIDLSRVPLPLIEVHDHRTLPIGVVENLRIIGGKLRGVVRFGNSQRARELFADVKGGVLRSLSVGYQILKHKLVGDTLIATRWLPAEVSVVGVPADPGAGFFRSASGVPAVLHTDFSITNMIRAVCAESWNRVRSHEKDVVDELHERYGVPDGIRMRLPDMALRDLTIASASGGGYLTEVTVGSYVDTLRPVSAALMLGAQTESIGQSDRLTITGQGGVTVKWLSSESDTTTESTPLMGSAVTTPKFVSAYAEISRNMLLQSNAEPLVRREFRNAAAEAVDTAVIAGSGVFGQPLGILGTPGVGTFTGTSLNYAAITSAQTTLGTANGVINRSALGWATTPTVAGLLKQRHRVASTSSPLWEGDANDGTIDDRRAISTTGMTAATAVYGDWSGVTIHSFAGGLQIELDPYTKFTAGIVGVRLLLPVDVVVTRPKSFVIATSIT